MARYCPSRSTHPAPEARIGGSSARCRVTGAKVSAAMPLPSASARSPDPLNRLTAAVFGATVARAVTIVRLPLAPTGAELVSWSRGAG